MPSTDAEREQFGDSINSVCDRLRTWKEPKRSTIHSAIRRASFFLRKEPIPVASDYTAEGSKAVRRALEEQPDVVVFDFPHSVVLAPNEMDVPSVLFTHNIEAEIFKRHVTVASNPLLRAVWNNQYRKMLEFERKTLQRFDRVVTVSERDGEYFSTEFGIDTCRAIPTGVDTEFFDYRPPNIDKLVVFCGSMDWMANVDGVTFFHDEIWPLITEKISGVKMKVVGRAPPESLVRRIAEVSRGWEFTGFVDDVRDHVAGAAAFVIPLRVGGGTRIKAFEAMAMGTPVVSTPVGIEGLPVTDGQHYLSADDPAGFANQVIRLMNDRRIRLEISENARSLVESTYGFRRAAKKFEDICVNTMKRNRIH
jgi:glycosyltransferase involved in cell wall biosynthesis